MKRKSVILWGMYDFANTIYSMNVVSLYFPLLITTDLGGKDIFVSIANSASMLLVVTTMPFLGILSDRIGKRTPFLLLFTLLSVIATAFIGILAGTSILLVSLAFVLANYGFHGGNVFYNTLLGQVSDEGTQGRASGIGTALGYAGSIVGMALVLPFNTGSLFGLNIPFIHGGGRPTTFVPTAILFMLFALPTIFHFWERGKTEPHFHGGGNIRLLISTIRNDKSGMGRFLLANFLFNDGVQTAIIFMAIFANKVLGMPDDFLTKFFMFSTVGAVVGSYLFGLLADRIGHKKSLTAVLIGWISTLVLLAVFPHPILLWILGMPIGAFLGGVWTTARPIVLSLSPKGEEGRYFGLYAFSGKLAAIIGPLIWGGTVLLLSPVSENLAYRAAIFALALLISTGLFVLRGVRTGE